MKSFTRHGAASAVVVLFGGLWCQAQDTNSSATRTASSLTTTPAPQYKPLTVAQRWREYGRSFGPVSFLRTGTAAAIGQWRDRPKEWPEGGLGYGYRFASGYAQHFTESTVEFGAAALLREDDRFQPSGAIGFRARTLYAVESPFLARRADGTRRISISRIGAIVGAAFIARAWQPHSTSSARSAELNIVTSFSAAIGFDFVREFWPRK